MKNLTAFFTVEGKTFAGEECDVRTEFEQSPEQDFLTYCEENEVELPDKKLKEFKDKNGYNLEIYQGETLIDWRCGLTKAGYNKYINHWNKWQSFSNPN